MACIGCGLALNADGKGRVDIDTNGGLKCTGTGDGGTSNTANNGLAVKVSAVAGNALQVSSAGVYVPPVGRFDSAYATVLGGSIADPNFTGGGSMVVTEQVSVTLPNTTAFSKVFFYTVSFFYSVTDSSAGYWIELAAQDNGGGWQAYGSQVLQAGNVVSPITMTMAPVTVAAGQSRIIEARAHVYTGHIGAYRVSLNAWGGHN